MSAPKQKAGRKSARRTVGGYKRERDDYYSTPARIVEPMLRIEELNGYVWEPACGDGALSKLIKKHFRNVGVINTDLIRRGVGRGGVDFLKTKRLLAPIIITNPPFKLWREFAEHALKLGARKVILFGRLLNLEGGRNSLMMKQTGLARVLISAGRVNILPRKAKDKGMSGTTAYAWFVWEKGHSGWPRITWFDPDPLPPKANRKTKGRK